MWSICEQSSINLKINPINGDLLSQKKLFWGAKSGRLGKRMESNDYNLKNPKKTQTKKKKEKIQFVQTKPQPGQQKSSNKQQVKS